MIIIETFECGSTPRHRPTGPIIAIRIDTSWPRRLCRNDAVTTSSSAGCAPAATALAQMRPPIIEASPQLKLSMTISNSKPGCAHLSGASATASKAAAHPRSHSPPWCVEWVGCATLTFSMTNQFHEANRRRWDAGSASWAHRADTRGIWKRCHLDPSLALHAAELEWLRDIAGKKAAVLGSGDNQVVFALAALGAKVTSIDISEAQIEIARGRAAVLGLQVDLVRADVVDLSDMPDATFDIIYTGGHVAVWVSDLRRYYGEAARILKSRGLLIVSEYHPFRRVWSDSASNLEVGFNYFNRGPHRFEGAPDVLCAARGELEQFEFHWTVADYITAILASGCQLVHAEEFGDACETWDGAPMAGLPASLLLVGQRAHAPPPHVAERHRRAAVEPRAHWR